MGEHEDRKVKRELADESPFGFVVGGVDGDAWEEPRGEAVTRFGELHGQGDDCIRKDAHIILERRTKMIGNRFLMSIEN